MTKRTLLLTHDVDAAILSEIKHIIPEWEVTASRDPEVWGGMMNDAEIIAGWNNRLRESVISADSKVRWIQTWSAGVNNLPLTELQQKEIAVTSANGVHAYPISETIFGLMLALTRKIDTYVKNQKQKKWHHANMKLEIHGKTIGIIGVGAIGSETAKIAKAFGMTVLGIRHSGRAAEYVDEMSTTDQLNEVLRRCDYVVVTLPLTEETKHMFKAEQFEQMKDSAFFINIGRGPIVDEADLISALKTGQIAGAGLDVFEVEPLPENSPLWNIEQVIITPHTSGSTEFYDQRLLQDIFIPNLKKYIEGEQPMINLLDYSKGY